MIAEIVEQLLVVESDRIMKESYSRGAARLPGSKPFTTEVKLAAATIRRYFYGYTEN